MNHINNETDLLTAFSRLEISGHILSALMFVLIAVAHHNNKRRAPHNLAIQLACIVTAACELSKFIYYCDQLDVATFLFINLVSQGAWLIALVLCIQQYTGHQIHKGLLVITGATWISSLLVLIATNSILKDASLFLSRESIAAISLILVTLSGIVLIEQLYRNSTMSDRDNIKYLCLGLAILLSFHLYDYTYISLFSTYDPAARTSDGIIMLVSALVIMLSALRTSSTRLFSFSRPMAFYSTSTIAGGLFLTAMSIAAYYVRVHGGSWGATIQLIVLFSSSSAMLALIISRNTRRRLTVFINKHFFSHKYDYRHVWLKLIDTLSKPIEEDDFYQRSIMAIANIFESPGGCIWVHNKDQRLVPVASWNMPLPEHTVISSDCRFCALWEEQHWVYAPGDTNPLQTDPYLDLIPESIASLDDIWVIIPLRIEAKLAGFILLQTPPNASTLIWEDLDLMRTVSNQLSGYIARHNSAEQLAESKQFDAYNRLTAFIMHDLKNLIAQQALVVDNATKHKENPAFVEDAIKTIDNSVSRMGNLLKKLQSSNKPVPLKHLIINKIVQEAIRKSNDRRPNPALRSSTSEHYILGEDDQLVMAIMHLIRNAQDATHDDGFIDITIHSADGLVKVCIEDNGSGMSADFIQQRLFKPFESTKSSMGMGIGVFQVREIIRSIGGSLEVTSEPGVGSCFVIAIPEQKPPNIS